MSRCVLAGPGEVLVIADETGNPTFIAIDLLAELPARKVAVQSWRDNGEVYLAGCGGGDKNYRNGGQIIKYRPAGIFLPAGILQAAVPPVNGDCVSLTASAGY